MELKKEILCSHNTPAFSAQNTEILSLGRRLGRKHKTQNPPALAS